MELPILGPPVAALLLLVNVHRIVSFEIIFINADHFAFSELFIPKLNTEASFRILLGVHVPGNLRWSCSDLESYAILSRLTGVKHACAALSVPVSHPEQIHRASDAQILGI